MKSRASIFGHPIHPIVIAVPLGLLPASLVTDLVHFLSGDPIWGMFSFWLIAGGLAGGMLAAVFGFIDWTGIPRETRSWRLGAAHGLTNLVVVGIFAVSLMLRWQNPGSWSGLATGVSVLGLMTAGLGGWLGGELVFRLGVGVHDKPIG